jgi:adenosine deaminase
MNLLLSTLGRSWSVIPELYAFTNPERLPLYANHPERERMRISRSRGF